ncbi:MAG: cation transporter [Ruminococcaceae bacterium]|nr:cation transporter [Oscillospiraceae bacterium]
MTKREVFSLTELLCRLFVKDRENIKSPAVRRAYGTLASIVGIIVNVVLAAGKLTVGLLFGAISLAGDGINNLSDAGSQIISLISFKMAAKPADRDHPFGHARIEYVASMIVSFFVMLVGWNLFRESIDKIFDAERVTDDSNIWLMVGVLAVSILSKLWLVLFNRRIAKKIDSAVMRATAADSLSDAGASTAVLIAMLIFKFTGIDIDGYMGAAVAVVIFIAGIKILNDTKNSILGEAPSDEVVEGIKAIVAEFPEALGIHDMVVHSYGPGRFVANLHVEVDGSRDIFESHDMIDLIEKRLNTELGIQSNIHMDPIVVDDEEVNNMRAFVLDRVKTVDERLAIHDFRFVRGKTHTNLLFDISAPFEVKLTDDEIKSAVQGKIAEEKPGHFVIANVDRC